MQSAFTIRVEKKQKSDVCDVSVLYCGEVQFSTSYRNVKWAFFARFPATVNNQKVGFDNVGVVTDDVLDEKNTCQSLSSIIDERLGTANNNSTGKMQEYLCVFYNDEPKNRVSHYTANQFSTICSAYNTEMPAAVTHFVLKNIIPTNVVPGLRGVFVRGYQQSTSGVASKILLIEGSTFHQAADMWWMASQLTINSIYVASGGLHLITNLPLNPVATISSVLSKADESHLALRYMILNATVLTQFQTCNGRLMTVSACEKYLCLATNAVVGHLDILLWVWWPQRLYMPQLFVKGATVSVTISESLQARHQVLFLFDVLQDKLHVVRTPDLFTGEGVLELLFSLSTNCPPLVFPCLREPMMQPIMVFHYPAINEVTLYHVPILFNDSSPCNGIATMSLANALPKNTIIDGILYQMGSSVSFHITPFSHESDEKEGNNVAEGKCGSCVVCFPSLLEEQHPLPCFIIEALGSVLEANCVELLQCEIIQRAWESNSKGYLWDFKTLCIELIKEIVYISMTKNNRRNRTSCNYRDKIQRFNETVVFGEDKPRLCDVILDPMSLSADMLREQFLCETGISKKRTTKTKKHTAEHFVSNLRLFWTPQQCGLAVFILHLLCESFKLQDRLWVLLEPLAKMNFWLSQLMGWTQYVRHYSTCLCLSEKTNFLHQRDVTLELSTSFFGFESTLPEDILLERFFFKTNFSIKDILSGIPPLIYTSLQRIFQEKVRISGVWPVIKNISHKSPISLANRIFYLLVDCLGVESHKRSSQWWFILCKGLIKYGIDSKFLFSELSVGVSQLIKRAINIAKDNPDEFWDDEFNLIIGRLDRLRFPSTLTRCVTQASDVLRTAQERAIGKRYRASLNDDDGVIMRLDFPKQWGDSRIDIVQNMLNTAAPIALSNQVDGVDIIHTSLKALSKRATALPVGRGMFTLCTRNFRVRDSVPIPRLNLDGQTSDGVTITNNLDEASADNLIWPLFHNGCAAGLRFLPLAQSQGYGSSKEEEEPITKHWVLYQTRNITCLASRSGLLLAAGLLGHLKLLQRTDIYSLLVSPQSKFSGREVVTIAVMIGLSCSLRGTCNSVVFNCLSMHIQPLTPATEDIEVSLDVQTAALVSIGILNQRCPDAFLVEMLLVQMSRLPSDEHFCDREGYALGAGFSLGLLLLGFGSSHGVPNVENRLLKFMEGARREEVSSTCEGLETFNELNLYSGYFLTRGLLAQNAKDSFQSYCTRVYEGDRFNIAVSSPAAVVALGFIYMQTNDLSMAKKVAPAIRLVGLQGIYPNLCLLRSMMSSLIMWSNIEPTREWLRSCVPQCLLRLAKFPRQYVLAPAQICYLMMNLGYCLAGGVLALGMRFAGSMNEDAKAVVLAELNGFMRGNIGTTGTPITQIQRSTGAFHNCISSCCVALSLIMAGTGDAHCLAVLQKLYRRTNVTYGDHLAVSMAVGLLFLGGGQLTLSSSLSSVAALVMAFYPIWPDKASDNRMHLQALRQLYCLAVVPRVIETVDVLTNRPVSVPVRVILHPRQPNQNEFFSERRDTWTPPTKDGTNQVVRMVTPCLLPDASTVSRIEICSAQHYNFTIENFGANFIGDGRLVVRVLEKDTLKTDLGRNMCCLGEELLVDWIQRLFCDQPQRRPAPIVATAILENVNLFIVSHDCVFVEHDAPKCDFSQDFITNVKRTMEKRYAGFLQRCGEISQCHPLYQLVVLGRSLHSCATTLVNALSDCNRCPRNIEAVAESLRLFVATAGAVRNGPDNGCVVSVSAATRWISQALCFYGLGGDLSLLLHTLEEHAALLQCRDKRLFALHLMNQRLFLCMRVLEDVVDCCVEYVD